MRIHRLALLILGVAAGACSTADGPTTPVASTTHANAYLGTGTPPGWNRTLDAIAGTFTPLNCAPREIAQGSAIIGPKGGILQVGSHRLIVPAGALTSEVLISGTVPEGRPFEIDLQPHGLQFKKPAGLILDASSCVDVPTIVYIVDQVEVGDPIPAFYSNWWKAIACPIWHFSGYMIALGDNAESHEIGAQ
jgi:hypothetical protein